MKYLVSSAFRPVLTKTVWLVNVGKECFMQFMARGVWSSGWYSTRRSRVLYQTRDHNPSAINRVKHDLPTLNGLKYMLQVTLWSWQHAGICARCRHVHEAGCCHGNLVTSLVPRGSGSSNNEARTSLHVLLVVLQLDLPRSCACLFVNGNLKQGRNTQQHVSLS